MGLAVTARPQPMGQGDRQRLEAIGLQQPLQIGDGAVEFGQLALVVLEVGLSRFNGQVAKPPA